MLFEIFYLLFHTKCVTEYNKSLFCLKMVSKSALSAFEYSGSKFFVNINKLKYVLGDLGDYTVYKDILSDKQSFVELLSLISTELMMFNYLNGEKLRVTNIQHVLRDPFYPDKANLIPGRVLRMRAYLRENPYLDSILNCPMKPLVTRIID